MMKNAVTEHRRAWSAVVRATGTVLLLVGALVVVWGLVIWVWGDPFTSVYTSRQQAQLERAYEVRAREFTVRLPHQRDRSRATAIDPVAIQTAAQRYRRRATPGSPLGRLRVPALGLNMMFVAGTDTSSLRKGPGWDARTSLPGEGRLVYIAGHRTTYKAPFGHIDQLKPGDSVLITVPYGQFAYQVTESVVVPSSDVSRLVSRGRDEIALQACHPRFSARERYIVYARLIKVSAP